MIEVRREGDEYHVVVSETCSAPPEVVYDLLADLRSHLEWGGTRLKSASQRLMSIEAPEGPATEGVEFSSVGHTSGRPWRDRSRVTKAERPRVFEFETSGHLDVAADDESLAGEWLHRYEISKNGVGAKVTYSVQARLTVPWYTPANHHARYPAVIYNIFLPIVVERGIRSLVAMAQERAAVMSGEDGPTATAPGS
jgi:hypothetical protein